MLKDLQVLNGTLDLKFNEYTYEYTITVDETVNALELAYTLDDDCYVEIKNNVLNYGNNIVYLDVYNVDKTITYTLYVYKENSNLVNGIENYREKIELSHNKEFELYKVQFLAIGIFLLIVFIFTLMFRKKKIN